MNEAVRWHRLVVTLHYLATGHSYWYLKFSIKQAESCSEALGLRGPLKAQCRQDTGRGRPYYRRIDKLKLNGERWAIQHLHS